MPPYPRALLQTSAHNMGSVVTRIGYLIPEFPGQTHILFWREREALLRHGIEPDLVSTRLPRRELVSHTWAEKAISRTEYLYPVPLSGFRRSLGSAARAFPGGLARCSRSIRAARGLDARGRLRLLALAAAGCRLADIARRRGWTHVHVHSCADAAHVALFAHLLSDLSYSVTLHGPLEDYGPNQREKWRHAAFGIVITQRLLDEVHRELDGSLPPVVEIAPMGVDAASFQRSHGYEPWRGGGPLSIFSCGRLNLVKGHQYVIEAVARLRTRGLPVRLVIAGEDEQGGSGYRRTLEGEIAARGLGEDVTLLGAVSEERVRQELERAHLFCLASLAEPLGVAIMEAMAAGVPVVATRRGGVPELVDDGVDGLLVSAESAEEVAAAIERLARDPELARRLSGAGMRKVASQFSSERSAGVLARCVAATLRERAAP